MSVPAEIRAVPRPVNTVVENTGKPGPKQYPVRMRADTKYVPGGNPQPHNGRVIGHIIDGRFVPRAERTASGKPEALSYGLSAFVWSVSGDILEDLEDAFGIELARAIYAVAALRAQRPRVSDGRLASEYEQCFLSQFCPGIPLSKDFVEERVSDLGKDVGSRTAFFKRRKAVLNAGHHVAMDGLMLQAACEVGSLSDHSRKSRAEESLLLLYAYDMETGEPLYSKTYSGSCGKASAYRDFIKSSGFESGILVVDECFSQSGSRGLLSELGSPHYLVPVEKSDSRIKRRALCELQDILQEPDRNVLCKKTALGDGCFLYSFQNEERDADRLEERVGAQSDGKGADDGSRRCEQAKAIVLESDQDLDPSTIYESRRKRRILRLAFKQYGRSEYLTPAGEPSDFSAIGSEFVNFIATLITCRLVAKAEAAGLLNEQTFGDLKNDLSQAWRKTGSSAEPASDDGEWVHAMQTTLESLEVLGLSKPVPKPEPKKRGRPRKTPEPKPELVGPKRPRGRPRRQDSAGEVKD